MFERWREFRARQREALHQSNHPHQAEHEAAARMERERADGAAGVGDGAGEDLRDDLRDEVREEMREAVVSAEAAAQRASAAAEEAANRDVVGDLLRGLGAEPPAETTTRRSGGMRGRGQVAGQRRHYGELGRPLNRQSPFYFGFVGALGVLAALGLWQLLARTTTTITVVVVAIFLVLALNPIVEFLADRWMSRTWAVASVFAGVVVVFVLLALLVVPPVADQGTALVNNAPQWANEVLNSRIVQDLDRDYDIVDKVQSEFNDRLTDETFIGQVLGGVFGVGQAVANGIFQTFTVLILSLFLLAGFPRVKQAAYAMVPASRRPRFESLSEEMMRRTGSYAIGQVAVATVNAILSWLMMLIVGVPYPAVLAVVVGFLGLIPMVGATIGAALVALVAVFDDPQKAIIVIVYYVLYQQFENYVIAPRIMQRTVAVPGAVTIVAALAGGTILGVLGALLAIPVAAALLLLYEEVLLPRQSRS